jgi:hypothetical protein
MQVGVLRRIEEPFRALVHDAHLRKPDKERTTALTTTPAAGRNPPLDLAVNRA